MPALTEARDVTRGTVTNLVKSGDLTAVGQTPWMPLSGPGEHVFTCDVEAVSAPLGTFIVEAQQVLRDGTRGTVKTIYSSTLTTDFPQVGRLSGWWEVRVRCSAYTSGTYNASVTQ